MSINDILLPSWFCPVIDFLDRNIALIYIEYFQITQICYIPYVILYSDLIAEKIVLFIPNQLTT